jgi:transposase InsO family protein
LLKGYSASALISAETVAQGHICYYGCENSTLKRLLADAELEKGGVEGDREGKLLSPERRRAAVRHLMNVMNVSERFACRVTGQHTARRSDVSRRARHRPIRTRRCGPGCAAGRRRIRGAGSATPTPMRAARAGTSITSESSGSGVRKGCGVPQRRRRKRIGTSTVPDPPKAGVWAVDSQVDVTTDGRPVKIVSIIDEHTRECLGGLFDRSITADRLVDELDRIAVRRGYPAVLRCDNGPEPACDAMADWAGERVGLSFIPPSQPWRNGYVESFNARVRDECLNINIFWSLAHARVVITDWKEDYNHRRRHSALGYQAPADYTCRCTHR